MKSVYGRNDLDDWLWSNKDKITVMYFGAPWCGPCKALKARLIDKTTKKEMPELEVCYIDIEDKTNIKIAEQWSIQCLPTQIFVRIEDSKVVQIGRVDGYDWTSFSIQYNEIKKN